MPQRQHSSKVIVYCAGKNTTQNYPQVCRGSELGTHYGAEDRAGSCDVKELDHEDLPSGQGDVVYAVGLAYGRGNAVLVRAEDFVYELAVNQVTQHKCDYAEKERYHMLFCEIA